MCQTLVFADFLTFMHRVMAFLNFYTREYLFSL